MISFGYVPAGTVLYIPFNTFNSSGASVTITGLAVTDIEVYKNGSTTQRASDNGYALLDTDGIDFDGLTGIHGFSVDTSDNSDSGFYSAGGQFWVVVSAITVDGQTVSFVAATFAIEPSTARVPVNVISFGGSALTQTGGRPEVNATHLDGVSSTALRRAMENMTVITLNGTPTNTTAPNSTLSSSTNDKYKGRPLYYLTGNLAGEIVEITAYNGSTKTLTHTAAPSGLSATAGDLALIA